MARYAAHYVLDISFLQRIWKPFLRLLLVFAITILYFNARLILLVQFDLSRDKWSAAFGEMKKRDKKEAERSLGFLLAPFPVFAAGAWQSIVKRHSDLS